MISIICAVAENGAIGFNNRLLYHLRADLQRFKKLTTGHTVIMGRRTFESLPKGALPNRRNIVLTRHGASGMGQQLPLPPHTELLFASSLAEALRTSSLDAGGAEEVFVIGGASVYGEAMSIADRLCLTHIHATPAAADAFFPEINAEEWELIQEEHHEADEQNEVAFTFADYVRRSHVPPKNGVL